LVAADFNNLAPCYYGTEEAFFNLGGIMNSDDGSTQQVKTIKDETNGIYLQFNFCEDALPAYEDGDAKCDEADSYAYVFDTSKNTCEGLKAPGDDKANTVAVQINDPEAPSNITGIALYYLSTDYELWVNITCDDTKDVI
jgi:hypothetical protein